MRDPDQMPDPHPLSEQDAFWFAVQARQQPVFGHFHAARIATIAAYHVDPADPTGGDAA